MVLKCFLIYSIYFCSDPGPIVVENYFSNSESTTITTMERMLANTERHLFLMKLLKRAAEITDS